MRVSMGMDMGMGGMANPGAMMEEEGMFMSFYHSMPLWLQGLSLAVLVIALAWIAGIIVGKLYASVKYPDPEKPSLVNPLVKIGLGAAIVACGFWIFSSIANPAEPKLPEEDPDAMVSEEISPDEGIMTDSPMVTEFPEAAANVEVAVG